MAKVLRCSDTGMKCKAVITGEDEEDVFEKTREHARSVHSLALRSDAATRAKLRSAIKDQ